ncbi:ABC transporter permease subunit [Nocardia huaxiensis]|uniref:ABC transporter permease subunit n=1 Tax=Nocardia huaxiensis TaxID=2755382 RepID=A0A7D6ZAW5_9NOCA|nr:ABC transporter permease subunit [Nocardia huaxiensis]QLY29318.1 ABC transporter permease subunit [Nocardia huaxiensis]UFS97205.1 ABC transporter permease subunit [Nocardia huaxiensis]
MKSTVFTQTLKEQRRGLIGWSIGLGLVPMMYLPSFSSMKEQGSLSNIKQNDVYTAMGMSDFGSAAGYLQSTIFALMGLLLMVIFAVTMAGRTASQEDSGTLDLLLAQPISRTSLLAQRFAALAVQVAVVTTVLAVGVLAGANAGGMDVPAGNILAAVTGLGLLGLAVGALTLLVGAVTGKRAQTLGFAALLVVGGYLANSLGAFIDGAKWMQNLSPFHYAIGDSTLVNGWNAGNLGILAALAAVAIGVALTVFNRRDLAV